MVSSADALSFNLKEKVNLLPILIFDFTSTYPPKIVVIFFDMYSPRPTPLVLISFEFSKNPKSLNNLGISFSAIPTPVSSTDI